MSKPNSTKEFAFLFVVHVIVAVVAVTVGIWISEIIGGEEAEPAVAKVYPAPELSFVAWLPEGSFDLTRK